MSSTPVAIFRSPQQSSDGADAPPLPVSNAEGVNADEEIQLHPPPLPSSNEVAAGTTFVPVAAAAPPPTTPTFGSMGTTPPRSSPPRRVSLKGGTAGLGGGAAGATAVAQQQQQQALSAASSTTRGRVFRSSAAAGVAAANPRLVTREIAALDFLLGIPLEAEASIVRAGLDVAARAERRRYRTDEDDDSDEYGGDESVAEVEEDLDAAGRPPDVVRARLSTSGHHEAPHAEAKSAEESDQHPSRHPHPHPHDAGGGEGVQSRRSSAGNLAAMGAAAGGGARWWEKLISKDRQQAATALTAEEKRRARIEQLEEKELERPTTAQAQAQAQTTNQPRAEALPSHRQQQHPHQQQPQRAAPGRRLDGREAVSIETPPAIRTNVMQQMHRGRSVATNAAVRMWEIRVAHGIGGGSTTEVHGGDKGNNYDKGLLDGRAFFSCGGSYPVAVFSLKKYEPKKEEAARRRKKLEEMGGGGTQFVIPERDWRGVSYAALLQKPEKKKRRPVKKKKKKRQKTSSSGQNGIGSEGDSSTDATSTSSSSEREGDDSSLSSGDESYVPGFLDDPEMVQGRHRHVMVGDKATGPMISSVIQFVKPADLKADLNKQFRDRFDGWEPPKERRNMIGAQVVNGVYTLVDPTEADHHHGRMGGATLGGDVGGGGVGSKGGTMGRTASIGSEIELIRMPPSLTLSKVRSLKQQALLVCVRANIEIGTLALACVYFERLCLDCRVDKSNRRLSFAACLLLAYKFNEVNVVLDHKDNKKGIGMGGGVQGAKEGKKVGVQLGMLKTFARPTKKSMGALAVLLEFFTDEWSLSLKHLFAAEWGVFAALGFTLHATPSQVAFHFKRLLKVHERNPFRYLGQNMYNQWQESLLEESLQRERHDKRREARRERKERKLMKLQRELQMKQQKDAAANRRSPPSNSTPSGTKGWESDLEASGAREPAPTNRMLMNDAASDLSSTNVSPLRKGDKAARKTSSLKVWNRLIPHQKRGSTGTVKEIDEGSSLLPSIRPLHRVSSSIGKDMDKLGFVDEHEMPGLRRSVSSPHLAEKKTLRLSEEDTQKAKGALMIDILEGFSSGAISGKPDDGCHHECPDTEPGDEGNTSDFDGALIV